MRPIENYCFKFFYKQILLHNYLNFREKTRDYQSEYLKNKQLLQLRMVKENLKWINLI